MKTKFRGYKDVPKFDRQFISGDDGTDENNGSFIYKSIHGVRGLSTVL